MYSEKTLTVVDIEVLRQHLFWCNGNAIHDTTLLWLIADSIKHCYGYRPNNYHQIVDNALSTGEILRDDLESRCDRWIYRRWSAIDPMLSTAQALRIEGGELWIIG